MLDVGLEVLPQLLDGGGLGHAGAVDVQLAGILLQADVCLHTHVHLVSLGMTGWLK